MPKRLTRHPVRFITEDILVNLQTKLEAIRTLVEFSSTDDNLDDFRKVIRFEVEELMDELD
jgi:hypothetical protein